MRRHRNMIEWCSQPKFAPSHGQIADEIQEAMTEFYGLTADGRLDFRGHQAIWPFWQTGNEHIFKFIANHSDVGSPVEFASALAWESPVAMEEIMKAMASD